jgi:transcriptional regulator with XRE-family HTH domain
MDAWRASLASARRRLRISREQLAELAGVSPATVRGYEDGRRHPRQETLESILRALRLERTVANPIREGAGFAPVRSLFAHQPSYFFRPGPELDAEVERVSWPQFVSNDNFEFVAANAAAEAVWGVDFKAERARRAPHEMNVLHVATEYGFPDVVENWDDVIQMVVRGFLEPALQDDVNEPSPYLNKTIAPFFSDGREYVDRLLNAWETVERQPARVRWHYAIRWRDPDEGRMRFHAMVSTASERDGLSFNDWIPLDAETWQVLQAVKARRKLHGMPARITRARPGPPS